MLLRIRYDFFKEIQTSRAIHHMALFFLLDTLSLYVRGIWIKEDQSGVLKERSSFIF